MRADAPRLMIAGTASGSGKTTLVVGLLCALRRRGLRVQACKCGPDYLDSLLHTRVLGMPSRNLDLFLGDVPLVRELVARGAQVSDLTLIEGVMGYYDGIAQGHDASSYELAHVTNTPVVLVVDARGRALSVAAEVKGFRCLRTPSHVAGVILNHVSKGYYPALKAMVERETDVRVLGFVPTIDEIRIESRHLGLVGPHEVADLESKVDRLASVLEQTLDVDALLEVAQGADLLSWEPGALPAPCVGQPLIAVARDEAMSFYYEDALALLEQLGARLVSFSPLRDAALPAGTCGLYLGGGYPELHARGLSENVSLRAEIRDALESGMPCVAECGGFLYLHRTLEDEAGVVWPMVGVVDGHAFARGKLGRFGYVTLVAQGDGLLERTGERLAAHEFHYWDSTSPGAAFHACKPLSSRGWDCVVSTPTLYAGFPHLYLPGAPRAARRFVSACAAFGLGTVMK